MSHGIRAARPDDVAVMQAIGSAAGLRFAEVDDARIAACADDESFDEAELLAWIGLGRAWIAVDDETPVGFVVVDIVDENAHIEEISVHPEHERNGHGSALLDAVVAWAGTQRLSAVTLTTFSDVPWNRPYYQRRGFRVLGDTEVGPQLAAKVLEEEANGLPAELRVCMSRTV